MSIRLFRVHVKVPIILLALIEGSLLLFVPFLAASLWLAGVRPEQAAGMGNLLPTATVFSFFGLLSLFAVGLYSTRQRTAFGGLAVRIVAAMIGAAALSAVTFYLVPSIAVSRELLAVIGAVATFGLVVMRLLFDRIVDQDLFKRRVLVYGAGMRAASLLQLRRRSDTRGFRIIAFIATEGDTVSTPADRLVARPADLFQWSLDHEIDEIVVTMDDRRRGFPMHELLECRLAGIEVSELPTFLERETGKVRLDIMNPSWIIFGEGFRASTLQRGLERGFDVIASLALLVLATPLMLLALVAIKLEDGLQAPVLYRQRRVGRYSECFDVLKFRSMGVDAEKDGAVWAVQNDPRVTWVGAFMRKTRIDELPQLFNVLRGDMSFVGPRPERPEFVEQLEQKIPYYRERHTVKPGITGWAQLCYPYGSSEKDALEKLQYDLYYVKNRSLMFDLAILVQTVEVVLWGKGAR